MPVTKHRYEQGRRRFLRNLGLGAGAAMFGPIASSLYSRAMGQDSTVQRFLIAITNGFPEVGVDAAKKIVPEGLESDRIVETVAYEWPSAISAFERFRSNALILDGIVARGALQASELQHGARYGAASGILRGDRDQVYGPSIEQIISRGPSGMAGHFPSVIFGLSKRSEANEVGETKNTFCNETQPIAHIVKARVLEEQLFGALASATSTEESGISANERRRRILDRVRADEGRLRRRLAAEERALLDAYVQAIDDFDAERSQPAPTCEGYMPGTPLGNDATPEAELTALFDAAGLAMRCGMTNVLGCAIGTDHQHNSELPWDTIVPDGYGPHERSQWAAGNAGILEFYCQRIVGLLERLSGEAGVMPANTTVVLLSDRGVSRSGHHHGVTGRWPAIILSSNPRIHTGGRYIYYPPGDDDDRSEERTLPAVFTTLAHAFDRPVNVGNWESGPLLEAYQASG